MHLRSGRGCGRQAGTHVGSDGVLGSSTGTRGGQKRPPRRKSGNFEGQVRGWRARRRGVDGASRPPGPPGPADRSARAARAQRRAQRGRSGGRRGRAKGARGRARARAVPRGPPRPPAAPRRRRGDPADRRRSGGEGGARWGGGCTLPVRARLRSGAGCRHSRGFGRRAGKFDGHPRGQNSRPCRKSGTFEGQVRGCEGARRSGVDGASRPPGPPGPPGPADRSARRSGRSASRTPASQELRTVHSTPICLSEKVFRTTSAALHPGGKHKANQPSSKRAGRNVVASAGRQASRTHPSRACRGGEHLPSPQPRERVPAKPRAAALPQPVGVKWSRDKVETRPAPYLVPKREPLLRLARSYQLDGSCWLVSVVTSLRFSGMWKGWFLAAETPEDLTDCQFLTAVMMDAYVRRNYYSGVCTNTDVANVVSMLKAVRAIPTCNEHAASHDGMNDPLADGALETVATTVLFASFAMFKVLVSDEDDDLQWEMQQFRAEVSSRESVSSLAYAFAPAVVRALIGAKYAQIAAILTVEGMLESLDDEVYSQTVNTAWDTVEGAIDLANSRSRTKTEKIGRLQILESGLRKALAAMAAYNETAKSFQQQAKDLVFILPLAKTSRLRLQTARPCGVAGRSTKPCEAVHRGSADGSARRSAPSTRPWRQRDKDAR